MKVISVENVSKKFILSHDRPKNLADGLRSLTHRKPREDFWALKDVSFEVEQGEALGIIGHNGAGKSTMLKILTQIMQPTIGRIRTRGRVSALIEVGAGFHPEMTGRENIYLNGSILGMTRREIDRKLDDIVAFAELEKFIDTPVKRYSSGMYARLGFSVAAHVEPNILLVDEVLAVGDLAFQKKCLAHMQYLANSGCSVILVTHSLYSAKRFCHRLLWINQGHLNMDGPPNEVALEYQNWLSTRACGDHGVDGLRWGAGGAKITNVRTNVQPAIKGKGFDVEVIFEVKSQINIVEPVIWVMLASPEGQRIAGTTTRRQPDALPVLDRDIQVTCTFRNAPLLPTPYSVYAGIFDSSLVPIDRWGDCATVTADFEYLPEGLITYDFDGSIYLDSEWDIRGPASIV